MTEYTKKLGMISTGLGYITRNGLNALNFSNLTLSTTVDGSLIKAGDSTTPLGCSTTASMKFLSFYLKTEATSGDARGIYNRLYIAGVGGGGESLRTYTTISDVAAATAHGAHISLSFATSGSITGLGVASRCTLEPAAGAMTGGTYAPVQSELYHAASADMTGVTKLSMFRVCLDGDATAITATDTKVNLLEITGNAVGDNNMVRTNTTTATHGIRIDIAGTRYDILCSTAHA